MAFFSVHYYWFPFWLGSVLTLTCDTVDYSRPSESVVQTALQASGISYGCLRLFRPVPDETADIHRSGCFYLNTGRRVFPD